MDNRVMHQHNHHTLSSSQNHWNYSSPITTLPAPQTSTPIIIGSGQVNDNANVWTPPSTRGVKRAMSESDCDDIYSEESSKDLQSPLDDVPHMMNRKKRRGVIEKKRRDRINSSLCELKRLVPSAFEKQGSAKLEKAEILQLTVDHLRSLHAKGIDSINGFDPQRFAMDYHIIGFRECASEVARYLVTIEGMDIQDPLRLRLMSHLQCFVAQRELSAKSTTSSATTYPPYQPNYTNQGYQNYPAASAPVTPHQQHNQSMFVHNSSYVSSSGSSLSYLNSTLPHSPEYSSGYSTLSSSTANSVNATLNNSASAATTASATTQNADQPTEESQQPIYTDLTSNANDRLMGNYSYANQLTGTGNQAYNYNNNNNSSKPYRPWHPEMAY